MHLVSQKKEKRNMEQKERNLFCVKKKQMKKNEKRETEREEKKRKEPGLFTSLVWLTRMVVVILQKQQINVCIEMAGVLYVLFI